jgi:hypothetical protein
MSRCHKGVSCFGSGEANMKRAILGTATLLLFTFHLCAVAADDSKTWVELGELTASDGRAFDQLGYSVAMSGRTIVLGARQDVNGNLGPGAAYVFVEPDAGNTQTAKLTASDGQPGDEFGAAVAISDNVIVVGAPNATMAQGAVYVFVRPSGGWTNMTETAKLTASDGKPLDTLGISVAISGNTIVSGAPNQHPSGHNNPTGKVYGFSEPSGGWKNGTETKSFVPPGNRDLQALFGFSVAIAGTTLVAGAPYFDAGTGAVGMFDFKSGNEIGVLSLKNAAHNINFGWEIAITTNASQIVVSAPYQSVAGIQYVGALYVFVEPETGWRTTAAYSAELSASDPSLPPYAASLGGWPIAVSSNGDKVVAYGWNANQVNAEYVFVSGSGVWKSMTQTYELIESNGDGLLPVALSGNTVCAGAASTTVNGNQGQGSAFVFQFK